MKHYVFLKVILVLFCCIFSFFDIFGQEKKIIKLLHDKKYPNTSDNVKSALFNLKTGKSLRVFQNKIKNGETVISFENGVISEEGKRIKLLHSNEEAILFNDNVLTTYSTTPTHEEEGITEIRAYQYNNGKLNLLKEAKFEMVGIDCKAINEGNNIILNDFGMEAGMNFIFFDKKLKHLSTYTPFKNGTNFYACNSNLEQTVIVSGENGTNTFKIAYFDKFCKLVKENIFTLKEKFRLNTLYIIGNQVVISGLHSTSTPHVYCIGKEGVVLWDKAMVLGLDYVGLGIVGNNEIAYALNHKIGLDHHFITSLDPLTGKQIEEISINQIYSEDILKVDVSSENKGVWVTDFKMNENNQVLILLAQMITKKQSSEVSYDKGRFLNLNEALQQKSISDLIPQVKFSKIATIDKKIILLNSKNIMTYEKYQ